MTPRSCPICGQHRYHEILRFTPAAVAGLNPHYRLRAFEEVLQSEADGLMYGQCECGMIYCPHRWTGEVLEKVYRDCIDHDRSIHKIHSVEKRLVLIREWEMILRILAIDGTQSIDGLKLADFGCGWGDFLQAAAGEGIGLLGLEQDAIKLAHARSRGLKVTSDLETFSAFGPCDVFVMNAVLEHVLNPGEILDKAHAMLKPGGLLALSTMDYRGGFIKKNQESLVKTGAALTMHLNPVEHVNVFERKTLLMMIRKHGFQLFASRAVLDWAGIPVRSFRNSRKLIRCLNYIEDLIERWDQNRELPIMIFAKKV